MNSRAVRNGWQDDDIASLDFPSNLRAYLQVLRDGGENIVVRNGMCWREGVKLEPTASSFDAVKDPRPFQSLS